jgi:hypothetical protein
MLSFFDIHYNLLFLALYVHHLTVSFGQMPCGIWMIRLIQTMEENSRGTCYDELLQEFKNL